MPIQKRHRALMPDDLGQIYDAMEGEATLTDEIALLDARITQLMLRMQGNMPDLKAVSVAFRALQYAIISQDDDQIGPALNQLDAMIHSNALESATWGEIYAIIDARRRLVADETTRVVKVGSMISAEEMQDVIKRLLSAISLHVTDPLTIAQISTSFRRVVNNNEKLIASGDN